MKQRILVVLIAAVCISVGIVSTTTQAQRRSTPIHLPDGEAKAMIEAACITCHRLNYISRWAGGTNEDWKDLISSMMVMPRVKADVIGRYLATHFPTKPNTAPTLIPGPVNVTIIEWLAPTLGSRPHDPLAASDGSIWWTGQFTNRLGRVDPATGIRQEFPLDIADSGPHGLVEDNKGNIWFTAVSKAYVGMLDPNSGDVTEYYVPDGIRGPHTLILDQRGNLWFTLQSGHVGRLVPKTKEMTIAATPQPVHIHTASRLIPKECPGMLISVETESAASIQKQLRLQNMNYPILMRVHDASLLHRMTRCGIRITLVVIWDDLTPKPRKYRNGSLLVGQGPNHMALLQLVM